MHRKLKCPSHGSVAGYLGLMFGILALTGGSSFAAQILNGKALMPGSVKTAKLAKGSVTAAKLHKSAVTAVKLHNSSVTALKLAKGAVTTRVIKNGSITSAKFASHSVTPAMLGLSSVTSEKLADSSITTSKLADGSVTGPKVPLQVVTASTTIAPGTTGSATATCPAGTRAFGGGVKLDDATITINTGVRQSQPLLNGTGDPVGWSGTAISLVVATPFHVYAVCG